MAVAPLCRCTDDQQGYAELEWEYAYETTIEKTKHEAFDGDWTRKLCSTVRAPRSN
ncbi:hypothetical protein FHS42_006345 [Streptomyces zagrosensis]|uniref:Uncharacterized protein n=1 Tax=Streptomyces zagrosensis TaxID=1042984 RepID=A0A7W9QHD7_9ACTN|nr:hypothetical protein [Streptomyces zagrosensis]